MNTINNNYFELESYKIAFDALSRGLSRKESLDKLKEFVLRYLTQQSANHQEMNFAWNAVLKMFNMVSINASRAIFKNKDALQAMSFKEAARFKSDNALSSVLKYYNTNKTFRQEAIKLKDELEIRQKQEHINEILTNCYKNKQPFVICDYHLDSRSEHHTLQGKKYIDSRWKSYIDDDILARKIEKYVKNNNILTIQSVIQAPYWLVTGKNCRHRLKNISNNAALLFSNRTVLRKNKLIIRKYNTTFAKGENNTPKLTLKLLENELKRDTK